VPRFSHFDVYRDVSTAICWSSSGNDVDWLCVIIKSTVVVCDWCILTLITTSFPGWGNETSWERGCPHCSAYTLFPQNSDEYHSGPTKKVTKSWDKRLTKLSFQTTMNNIFHIFSFYNSPMGVKPITVRTRFRCFNHWAKSKLTVSCYLFRFVWEPVYCKK